MKRKEYGLHFRYRNERNELHDVGLVCEANSAPEAKRTAWTMERPSEKVWFIGLIPPDVARNTGGKLP